MKPSERDELFDRVLLEQDWIGWALKAISPQDISEFMFKKSKYNLNSMAHDTTIELIRGIIQQGVQIHKVSFE